MHPDENRADIVSALARVMFDTYSHETADLMACCIYEYTLHQSHIFPWTRLQELAELVEEERRALLTSLESQLVSLLASCDHPEDLEIMRMTKARMKTHLIEQVVSRMHLDDMMNINHVQLKKFLINPSPCAPTQLQCEQHQCPLEDVMLEIGIGQVWHEPPSAQ